MASCTQSAWGLLARSRQLKSSNTLEPSPKPEWLLILKKEKKSMLATKMGPFLSSAFLTWKLLYVLLLSWQLIFVLIEVDVFKAHNEDICDIKTFDDKNLMITASKDKSTRFWQLPKSFVPGNGEVDNTEWKEPEEKTKPEPAAASQYLAPKPSNTPYRLDKENEFGGSDSDSDEAVPVSIAKPKQEEAKPFILSVKEEKKKEAQAPPPIPMGFGARDDSDEEDLDGWDH